MFTHLATTLSGLSTVRAYKAEKILKAEFDKHQDTHSACWFLFISTGSAFGISLDTMCLLFITCIMSYFMLVNDSVPADQVGLAITQAMGLIGTIIFNTIIYFNYTQFCCNEVELRENQMKHEI